MGIKGSQHIEDGKEARRVAIAYRAVLQGIMYRAGTEPGFTTTDASDMARRILAAFPLKHAVP